MRIEIICIGKLKEDYLRAAQTEYLKRLGPYARLSVIEVAEEKAMEKAMASGAHAIALAIDGKALTSEGLAQKLENMGIDGISHIAFIIGGAEGLSHRILGLCRAKLSLSAMTMTHQMARVFLLEQIYRSFKIINNEPYHK
ncbi:MAG: 23S rRNA (pseudouridine(1915)-N(3))-methyltransferase RlmH [Defluviitaleaceae bacterium]|nr:23S rRNA (pseudouridine(1915)-N(3))-methyltransferase RlmH [Defluviitaleaceae bacterium]